MTTNAFRKFWDLGYRRLIPITPPLCEVSPNSSLARRPKDLGKAPGVRGHDGFWRGVDYVKLEATEADLDAWHAMGAGVGVKTGDSLIVIDIDVLDKEKADTCGTLATKHLGHAENRVGRSPKRAKFYRVSDPVPYQRLRFDGGHVELLSEGKQCVVAGLHPVSGQFYSWPRGTPRFEDLKEVTPAQIADYFAALAAAMPAAKHEVSSLPSKTAVEPVQLEGKAETVRKALAALPNDARFDSYDEWIKVAQAIRGALPNDDAQGLELFQEWSAKWSGDNDPDVVASHWRRCKPSHSLGAQYLYSLAAAHGAQNFSQAEAWFTASEISPEADLNALKTSWLPQPISDEEWAAARATRPAIVDNWFYEDVGHLAAPGGVGKTTLLLFQAVHIVTGRPLFGCQVRRPGPVVYMTAEDDRETMVARLRCMCREMNLNPEEIQAVRDGVRIVDVAGRGVKLAEVIHDVVRPSETVDRLIEGLAPLKASMFFIDPLVSFGVGESRVNDAEQGLIDVARRFRADLGCGVHFAHHTGKENARNKTLDQYTGRGGSALSDGSRVTHVMQSLNADEWRSRTGVTLEEGSSGLVYARPKLTWAPPNQPDLFIRRRGYTFDAVRGLDKGQADRAATEQDMAAVLAFLQDAEARGETYTAREIRDMSICPGGVRAGRQAVTRLIAGGRIEEREQPRVGRGRPTYTLHVAGGAFG